MCLVSNFLWCTTVLCIIPWIIHLIWLVCSSSTRCSDAYSDTTLGYANSIRTIDGGTHIEGVKASLTRTLNNLGKKSKIIKVFLFMFSIWKISVLAHLLLNFFIYFSWDQFSSLLWGVPTNFRYLSHIPRKDLIYKDCVYFEDCVGLVDINFGKLSS